MAYHPAYKVDFKPGEVDSEEEGDKKKKKKKSKGLSKAQKKAAKDLRGKKSNFNNTTRWLPDSSFATYCGKSPWHCYGKGNVNPSVGGLNYGNYLLSHNINSESGDKAPMYQQVYDNAL
jgi:hypothetical protein